MGLSSGSMLSASPYFPRLPTVSPTAVSTMRLPLLASILPLIFHSAQSQHVPTLHPKIKINHSYSIQPTPTNPPIWIPDCTEDQAYAIETAFAYATALAHDASAKFPQLDDWSESPPQISRWFDMLFDDKRSLPPVKPRIAWIKRLLALILMF